MAVESALLSLMLAEVDIYNKTETSGTGLRVKKSAYASVSISDQVCLLEEIGISGSGGRIRTEYGIDHINAVLLSMDATVSMEEGAKIVRKKWNDGTACSAGEQTRQTYIVQKKLDGRTNTGHMECVCSPEGRK